MLDLDWTVSPMMIWFGVALLVIVGLVALIISVFDWCTCHHDFVERHTPHWLDDPD